MKPKRTIGIVVGRFQPLHPGHLRLIFRALEENDFIIVVIGSSQIAGPLSAEERKKRLVQEFQDVGIQKSRYRLIELPDINNLPLWPSYLKYTCGLNEETENKYYSGDEVSEEFRKYLEEAGFVIRVIGRPKFSFLGPDGNMHRFNSATEIRELYRKLGKMEQL